jgi:hypothetical protein
VGPFPRHGARRSTPPYPPRRRGGRRKGPSPKTGREKPRVYYRNLWRYAKCFICGTVSAAANGVVDCVEGARVRLVKSGAIVAETTGDNYGDFKFDRLDENSGAYTIEIEAKGRAKKSVDARLGVSINRGEIRL